MEQMPYLRTPVVKVVIRAENVDKVGEVLDTPWRYFGPRQTDLDGDASNARVVADKQSHRLEKRLNKPLLNELVAARSDQSAGNGDVSRIQIRREQVREEEERHHRQSGSEHSAESEPPQINQ